MGGIEQAIIAKFILNDVGYMYKGLCFVECIESCGDCYTTSCIIFKKFNIKSKQKDVIEAQEMLKSFFIEDKTILVFNNLIKQI